MMTTKGQAWSFDLVIGLVIFLAAITIMYAYSINYESSNELDHVLLAEGEEIADLLLSEGSPTYWNETTVIRPGLTSNKRINQTKLNSFYELSRNSYSRSQLALRTTGDYFVNFSAPIIINSTYVVGFGKYPFNYSTQLRISRLTIMNNRSVRMDVLIGRDHE